MCLGWILCWRMLLHFTVKKSGFGIQLQCINLGHFHFFLESYLFSTISFIEENLSHAEGLNLDSHGS